MTDELQEFLPNVIDALSRGALLALGPGCHRIGYDEVIDGLRTPWDTVVDRMRLVNEHLGAEMEHADTDEARVSIASERHFLQGFLWSKLSDESRSNRTRTGEIVGEQHNTGAEPSFPGGVGQADRWRTLVARHLLAALVGCTQLLGQAIQQDNSPVIDWTQVRAARGRTTPSGEEVRRDAQFAVIERQLRIASGIAKALSTGRPAWPADQADWPELERYREALGASALPGDELVEWARLQPGVVAGLLDTLADLCFQSTARQLPSGATVEWLSDLFWHWITRGSRLPPSEADLAFYLDLRAGREADVHRFRRPRPGEIRASEPAVARAIGDIMGECTRAADELGKSKSRSGDLLTREKVMFALASSLVAFGARNESANRRPLRQPIALVTGYDLLLETSIMRCLEPGGRFHVIVPARLRRSTATRRKELVWLMGTFTRPHTAINGIDAAVTRASWRPIDSLPPIEGIPADQLPVRPDEPIVVKLHGSPLHLDAEGDAIEGALADLADDTFDPESVPGSWESVRAFVAYTESEVLEVNAHLPELVRQDRAVNLEGPQSTFAGVLRNEIGWAGRSWVLLGHRFADWLARLRVHALESTTRGESRGGRTFAHYAIDREFSYPERGILDTLGVTRYVHDLSVFAEYWTAVPSTGSKWEDYVVDVEAVYGRAVT